MPGSARRLAWLAALWGACATASAATTGPSTRIVFVGDSLVRRSAEEHGLLNLVKQALERSHPDQAFELVAAGVNGNCIADIRSRLDRDVVARRPDAVVLYWDSDAADVEGPGDPPSRSAALRSAYEANLDAVLTALTKVTPRVVVSGPTLLGERPHGHNPKDLVLDAYARINRWLSHRHRVSWVDTRRAAFHWLRRHVGADRHDSGQLTEDGEHLSAAGVGLVAERLAVALGRSLERPAADPDSLLESPVAGPTGSP